MRCWSDRWDTVLHALPDEERCVEGWHLENAE